MGLSGRRKIRIGDILINEGIISTEQLDEALWMILGPLIQGK